VTYNEKEKRGLIKLNLISLALTVGAILSLLVALGAIVVLPLILSSFGLGGWTEILLRFIRWPVLICLVVFGLAVLYRFERTQSVSAATAKAAAPGVSVTRSSRFFAIVLLFSARAPF
jgi:uncharacterized BrkB/YihY/UPF0761 family membrane protein